MAAMTESELADYFNEHVYYEMLMLRCSKECLEGGCTQLGWNVMFAAFNVSARNLYDFLKNNGGRASARVEDFRAYRISHDQPVPDEITGTLTLMHEQCFHMSKRRSNEADDKIGIERIRTVFEWVVSNMDRLIQSFRDLFRAKLRPEWSELVRQEHVITTSSQVRLLASSLNFILAADHTSTCQMALFEAPLKT